MQSFSQSIAESFHSEVASIRWIIHSEHYREATFTVKSVPVNVLFDEEKSNGAWLVSVHVNSEPADSTNLALHIFSGIFQSVREFLRDREPTMLVFHIPKSDAGIFADMGYNVLRLHPVGPIIELILTAEQRTSTVENIPNVQKARPGSSGKRITKKVTAKTHDKATQKPSKSKKR
jgi:hypothetical protein